MYVCILYFTIEDCLRKIAHTENERVYCARPSELLYGELLQRYISSVLLCLQTSQAILEPYFLIFPLLFNNAMSPVNPSSGGINWGPCTSHSMPKNGKRYNKKMSVITLHYKSGCRLTSKSIIRMNFLNCTFSNFTGVLWILKCRHSMCLLMYSTEYVSDY